MWGQLGWFSGLVCAGSVAGAAAWGSIMQTDSLYYASFAPEVSRRQAHALLAADSRWFAAFYILYPVDFLCLVLPKLMLLRRLIDNALRTSQAQASSSSDPRQKWLLTRGMPSVFKATAAAVVLCAATGIVAYHVAAAYFVQVSGLRDEAAAACDAQGNDTHSSLAFMNASITVETRAYAASSVQNVCEAVGLLLISVTYAVLVPFSIAMFRQAEHVAAHALVSVSNSMDKGEQAAAAVVDHTMHAAADQRRRLTAACAIVLLTFPARAAFNFLQAYSAFDVRYNPACSTCDPCQSENFLIQSWITFTPEFQPIVVAVSSPLPLALSLWLITKAHAQAYAISLNMLRASFVKYVSSKRTAGAGR